MLIVVGIVAIAIGLRTLRSIERAIARDSLPVATVRGGRVPAVAEPTWPRVVAMCVAMFGGSLCVIFGAMGALMLLVAGVGAIVL